MPYIKYKNLSEEQNHIMRQLARDVLSLAKEYNNSNEVAITCDIGADSPLEEYGISYGTVHYLYKDEKYDFYKAFALFKDIAAKAVKVKTAEEHYGLAVDFLKKCSEAGLFYV